MSRCRVLIVLMGSLGDVVRGGAVATRLKEAWPDAWIAWLVEPRWADIVRAHRAVDEVVVFRRECGLRGVLALRREVRRVEFDIVLDLQRHLKSGLFSSWARARRSIGVHRRNAKEFNWIFHRERTRYVPPDHSKMEMYGAFLEVLSINAAGFQETRSEGVDFGFEGLRERELPSALAERDAPYVAVVLGSSWESKDWPAQGYGELVRMVLAQTPLSVVLVGTGEHRELARALVQGGGTARVCSLVGATSVTELATVLAHARVGVGPDSGPGHLCAALGVPYVGIFGATDPKRTAPYGAESLSVRSAIGCSPCNLRRCPGLNRLCMRLVSPSEVMGAIERAIEGLDGRD